MTAQATITWADGSQTIEPLTSAGGSALQLAIRNPGKPDNWGNAWTPEPKFFSSVVVSGLPAGYKNLLGGVQNTRVLPSGDLLLVDAQDFKYQNIRNGVISHAAYNNCVNYHMIDGGATLYFRFVSQDDDLEKTWLTQNAEQKVSKCMELLGFDEARISQWPFLKKVLDLYTVDASTFSPVNTNGGTNVSWLLIPEHFLSRWNPSNNPGYATYPLEIHKHWYGFGSRAAGETFISNEHYGHDAWFIGQALRLGSQYPNDAQKFDQAMAGLACGLYLLRNKIAYGLIDSDTTFHKARWRNEKCSAHNACRGTAGTQPGAPKEYDLSLCLGHVICPDDPIISRAFQIRSDFWKTAPFQWGGGGGARGLGWALSNLRDFYITTGDVAFKNKAEAEITHAFSPAVNGMSILWFREYTQNAPGLGEAVNALVNCLRWCVDLGVRPDLIPHLQEMMNWYLTYGGQWLGTTHWQAGYFGANATNTSCTVTYNSNINGAFYMGLKKYANPAQLAQFTAIERMTYTNYSVSTFDSDYGGLGPSHEKWLPMFAESARQ